MFFFTLKKIPEGLDQQLATLKNGNLYNFFADVKKYVELGPEASILINSADYNELDTFVILNEFIELLSERQGIAQNPWLIWYRGV